MAKKKESAVADTMSEVETKIEDVLTTVEKTFTEQSLGQAIYDVLMADLVASTKASNESITEEEILAVVTLNKRKNANQASIIANKVFA